MTEHETLEVDVLFVGGGPAGLAGAIRLAQLAKQHEKQLSILLIEKGKEVGAHALSGAVMEPAALRELIPDFEAQGCPIETKITDDLIYFLTENECLILPINPPALAHHGEYVIALGRLTRWMAGIAEKSGVDVYAGFPGVQILTENGRVVGVRTGDKGIDKNGQPKANFEPGIDIKAKVTVLCEGPRGTLTRQLIQEFQLDKGKRPQVYATGVKEIWELPPGHVHDGRVVHSMGWPLKTDAFGGGFIYSMSNNRLDIGFVVGLDYHDPFMDPHYEFQRFKTHPKIRAMLEGGKMVEYGAKAIPEGGWDAMPRPYAPGAMLAGDSGGFLDAMRLKGVHLAIKSGMLAAETAWDALDAGDFSEKTLSKYAERIEHSWIKGQLRRSRNFKNGFKLGWNAGMVGAAFIQLFGWSPFGDVRVPEGHKAMRKIAEYYGRPDAKPVRTLKFDEKLTFTKLTDVYNAGTIHEENQPCHLKVLEPDICTSRCVHEYGNPCQHFCPAAVYEWVRKDEKDVGHLQINFTNCVHCKTCDIMDPYGIIRWVPPEGGGGPAWQNL